MKIWRWHLPHTF